MAFYILQVPGSEGRAGMAAILDKDDSLDLTSLAEGLRKHLPSYARPLFIRALNYVEMTGMKNFSTSMFLICSYKKFLFIIIYRRLVIITTCKSKYRIFSEKKVLKI